MKNRGLTKKIYLLVVFLFVILWFEFLMKIGFVLGGMTGNQSYYSFAGFVAIMKPFFIFTWISFLLYSMYMEKEKILNFISNIWYIKNKRN
ncbi:hypothetical protein ACQ3MN_07715 [Enterococcus faecalis]|uniref:hypothetical protein n=1 Tax=Enterococcus faecalis TaxID=1351 RepID=UPI003D786CBE